ncbi:MAG: transposase, partial [Planctomycetota bacterium]
MKKKRHRPDQIIAKLREAEAGQGSGEDLGTVCNRLEVSEQTYYRWRNQYGGMKGPEMKRLKELEKENSRLKKAVADLALDNQILKEV